MVAVTDPVSRITKVAAYQARRIKRVFLTSVKLIEDSNTLTQIAELLEEGRFEEALASVDKAGALLGDSYGAALSDSAMKTAAWLSSSALDVVVSFDQVNTRAVAAMQANKLRLVSQFTQQQREASRQAIIRGVTEGANPIEQARAFKQSIGLTTKQEAAVNNYRRLLTGASESKTEASQVMARALRDKRFDRTVARAAREGVPLTEKQINKMVGRYREKMIKYRSEVIARTESMRAVSEGQNEMYQQAIDNGDLTQEGVKRKWVAAKDERTRSSHTRLNGTVRMMGEVWMGDEGPLRFPRDPDAPGAETIQCRCFLSFRISN